MLRYVCSARYIKNAENWLLDSVDGNIIKVLCFSFISGEKKAVVATKRMEK